MYKQFFSNINKLFFVVVIVLMVSCKNDNKPSNTNTLVQLTNAAKLHPDSVSLHQQLIEKLDSAKQFDEALQQVDSLIFKDKLNANLWAKRGKLLKQKGDTAQAIEAFNKAATIYDSPDVLLELANLYAEKKDTNLFVILKNIKQKKQGELVDNYALFFEGVYYSRSKNYAKAISIFDQCIVSNYTFADAYLEKGYALYEVKNYANALSVFKKLSVVQNTNTEAYYWQAKCYETMNKKLEALLNYQKAYGLDKTNTDAKLGMERLSK